MAHVGRPSDRAVSVFRRLLGPLMRLIHRPTLEGTEHLPDGPFILVANLPRLLGLRRWPVTVLGAAGAAFIALAPGLGGWPVRLALL